MGCANPFSSAGIDELHRGVAEINNGGTIGGILRHGMVRQSNLDQTKTFSHSGNVPDFSAFMALIPEQKKGVILLFNADPYGLPLITEEIGMGVTALLAGQQPPPIKLDFIQWIMRFLPLIPLLQVVGVSATLGLLHRWEREPALRPSDGRVLWQHILLTTGPEPDLGGNPGVLTIQRPDPLPAALYARPGLDRPHQWRVCRNLGFACALGC